MTNLTIDNFKAMLNLALKNITERADEFSKLDAITGDGDHGTAIVTALTAVVEGSKNGSEFKQMLNDMGFNVMLQTSGSTSTLLGGFFLGMSDGVDAGLATLDASQVKAMFKSGMEGVKKNTKAMPGDKTMMDALVPAIEAIVSCDSEDVKEVLMAGAKAALEGAKATVNMKANFGRARNYGEKSIGYADSGATSWACMFESFANAL